MAGSIATLGQTSVRYRASKSLTRLCRRDGMAPFEQLSAWLRLGASLHAQCKGSISSCHPYLTHNASLMACMWRQNPNSWMGRAVSQLEAPFSLAWSIPNCCDLGSCGLSALACSCAEARLLIRTVAFGAFWVALECSG